ncbi:iron complex transport system substrate-binding protein [Phyllobacterium ifriqiyense]|uniref:Iron complex transport system substrate-binding protein n=1 Tax=Phyllobacterium ifriqiyense TaxID=314238 RepID=A0ABU0S5T7_9HYPH|nr:ABC transporter substrate-binding protein [Phyllobacterium ifriqiyense]MDQ0996121.1 iron complex transport system substrate-binding protein [Phyllobacterium ifriqiyense]
MKIRIVFVALLCLLTGAAASLAGETRRFANQFGTAEVPVAPRCVVSLHDFSLTTQLLELGITPCGSSGRKRLFDETIFRGASQRYDTSAIRYVGTHQAPDIETIAALKPDLIVGLSYHKGLRGKLSSIAPVVLLPVREKGIMVYAEQLADLVGKSARYLELQKEYRSLAGEFAKRVDDPDTITVTPMEIYRDGFRIIGRGGMEQVIADFGLGHVPAFNNSSRDIPYSLERLSDFDSDVIIDTYEEMLGEEAETKAFRSTAQWQNLFAVRNRQFLYFNRSRYGETMNGLIGSATLLLSHIGERKILKQIDGNTSPQHN